MRPREPHDKRNDMRSRLNLALALAAGALTVWVVARAPAMFRVGAAPIDDQKAAEAAHAGGSVAAAASPGRVEPRSEEIHVATEITGKVAALLVGERQRVEKGAVLVELENAEYLARLASARAAAAEKQATLQRVVSGAREQE